MPRTNANAKEKLIFGLFHTDWLIPKWFPCNTRQRFHLGSHINIVDISTIIYEIPGQLRAPETCRR